MQLAQQSVRFLDLAFQNALQSRNDQGESAEETPLPAYEVELAALHESVGQMVSVLMSDSANAVRQAMLEDGVRQLAEFFGMSKGRFTNRIFVQKMYNNSYIFYTANDIILSHMITFLNDKDDAQLRDSFYRNIVDVVAYIGWPSTQIIIPLLQQVRKKIFFLPVFCVNLFFFL